MTVIGKDSLGVRRTLTVNGKSYDYFSLPAATEAGLGDSSRLPYSMKVLLENMLRYEDGRTVKVEDVKAAASWHGQPGNDEIAFRPARVLLQDLTGVPAVVDLAAMREAMIEMGGDPMKINPLSAVDLVIDHSVMVDNFGSPTSFADNVKIEFERNKERYEFLRWGAGAFKNFRVVPPGTGICHQVNLDDCLSRHAGRHRQPHHDGERSGRARLGRRRDRGRGGDAGSADLDAAARGDRLQGHRRAQGRHHGHRSGADGDADAACQGRGLQIRRILWARPR